MAFVVLGDGVTHRLHKTVDQGGGQTGARGRLDAPGGHKAAGQCLHETLLPQAALLGRFGQREGTCDALVNVKNALFFAFAVFFDQHFCTDRLSGQIGNGRGNGRANGGGKGGECA